MHNMIIMLHF